MRVILLIVVAYLGLAYLVLPALWRHHEHNPRLAVAPMRTVTGDGIPGHPLNVALAGKRDEVVAALGAAGWRPADPISLRSGMGIAESVVLDRQDPTAPVSDLYLARAGAD